jgi:hypothetical protein
MKEAIEVDEGRSVCVDVKSIDEAFEYVHDGWRADLILLAIDQTGTVTDAQRVKK